MSITNLEQRVKEIIVNRIGCDESNLTPEAHFSKDLGADSLEITELIMDFETAFNITIPEDQNESLTTVGSVINYLEQLQDAPKNEN